MFGFHAVAWACDVVMLALTLIAYLAPGPELDELDAPKSELETRMTQVDGSAESLAALELALAELERFGPVLAGDSEGLRLASNARLLVARAYLALEDEAGAVSAVDEAIRSAMGDPMTPDSYGPHLLELYEARLVRMSEEGHAQIHVQCAVPCEVLINEHATSNPSPPLPLGRYRIWVLDAGVVQHEHALLIKLGEAGEVETLTWPLSSSVPEPSQAPSSAPPTQTATPIQPMTRASQRKLPRWAELLGVVGAVGLVAAGGVMLAFHHRCWGGGQPSDPVSCPILIDSHPQAPILVGLGSALGLAGAVTLSIDEVRARHRRGHQTTLTWTLRF